MSEPMRDQSDVVEYSEAKAKREQALRAVGLQELAQSVVRGLEIAQEWANTVDEESVSMTHVRAGIYATLSVARQVLSGVNEAITWRRVAEDMLASMEVEIGELAEERNELRKRLGREERRRAAWLRGEPVVGEKA